MTPEQYDTPPARPPSKEALRQMEILEQGTVDILPEGDLPAKIQRSLDANSPLRIKYGADPSAPDLHLGHTVPIRKLRQFQDLGHQVVFLIGDFTAMIGDPSGKSETRRRLTREEVQENAKTYFDQVYLILDPDRTEVVYNSDWLGKLHMSDVIELAAKYTVARMLERDDFSNRFKGGVPIYIHEFLYPLAQAYDSWAVRADVEVGGTDQKFNFLLGREIQREMNQEPQAILTVPILVGTDGVKKMSKSLGNYIGITEPPQEIFGKTMSVGDEVMADYLRLVLGYADAAVKDLERRMAEGTLHPRDLKARIAHEIVTLFHDTEAADAARAGFDRVFRDREMPEEMPEVDLTLPDGEETLWIAPALVRAGLCESNRKARQAVGVGSVRVDGEKVEDEGTRLGPGEYILQVGKRDFRRVRIGGRG
ncbi:tyrosine--tRNA ligase [Candidatus Sumerlaeota bacterium]|nr:tyrosine--tRNA ligase [Candidatus Sumerlaeota bacterium]